MVAIISFLELLNLKANSQVLRRTESDIICHVPLQVSAIVSFLLGSERAEQIQIFAGDVVPRKKPDPVWLPVSIE